MQSDTRLLRLDDTGDPWGSAMSHLFAICHVLEHRTYSYANQRRADEAYRFLVEERYHDSPICQGFDAGEWPDGEYRRWSTTRLIATGRVISRYCRLLRRAGRDY